MNKILYFDVETSGLSPVENDILQLAYIIEVDGNEKEKGEFKTQPFNYENISKEALEKNGLTIEQIKKFPEPRETYVRLVNILDRYVDKFNKEDKFIPSGHNVKFDIDFLNQFFIKNHNKFFFSYVNRNKVIDSLIMARKLRDEKLLEVVDCKLGTLCKLLNIEIDEHEAASDINASRELSYKLKSLKYDKFFEKYEPIIKEIVTCGEVTATIEDKTKKIIDIMYNIGEQK